MPAFLIEAWNFIEKIIDKIQILWQEFMALLGNVNTAKIIEFVDNMPATPESLIKLCRITAIAAAILGLFSLISAMRLNNGLPIGKAKQYLARRRQPVVIDKEPVVTVLEIQNVDENEEAKRPLISYTLSADAETLLEKLKVDLNGNEGWNIVACGITAY